MSNQHGPVVAIYNHDGGAGKTTTTLYLASYLAQHNQQLPLLIDFDPQGVLTKRIFGETPEYSATIADALPGKDRLIAYGKDDPLWIGSKYWAVAADTGLSSVAAALQAKSPNHHFLRSALAKVQAYDARPILIDCAPGLDILTVNMMFAADYLIIPVKCDEDANTDVRRVLAMVEDLGIALQRAPKILGVVLTHCNVRTIAYRIKAKIEALNIPILGEISHRVGQNRHDCWRTEYAPVGAKLMEVLNGDL